MVDKRNGVELEEGKLAEDEPNKDELYVDEIIWGFEGDLTCLVKEMERAGIPPNKGGREAAKPKWMPKWLGVYFQVDWISLQGDQ